jgi:LPXTG-site transpeptidase (sortase) family protein
MSPLRYIFGNILIILGTILLFTVVTLVILQHNPKKLAFATGFPHDTSAPKIGFMPVQLYIPAIHVALPVIPAALKDNVWPTTTEGVTYLRSTQVPGEVGNSILYGHNYPNLLGRLPLIKNGDIITINLSDNTQKKFIVTKTMIVLPTDTTILQNTTQKQITIYTCIGFLDTKRFVAIGTLVE